MNQESKNDPYSMNEQDGVDIRRVLSRIKTMVQEHYRRFRLWLALAAVVIVSVFVLGLFLAPPMTTYSEAVAFTFPQSEKGRYPNGSPFSITDLVNRNVLDQVWRDNKLEGQGVSFQSFSNSVSVVAFADNEALFVRNIRGCWLEKI